MALVATNFDLHMAIKQAVIKAIVDLSLPGIDSRVYDFMTPMAAESNSLQPCVLVTMEGEEEEPLGGDTEVVDRYYPVQIYLVDAVDVKTTEQEKMILRRRKMIFDAFNQRTLDLPGIAVMYVVPKVVLDPDLNQFQKIYSGMTIRIWASEPRIY